MNITRRALDLFLDWRDQRPLTITLTGDPASAFRAAARALNTSPEALTAAACAWSALWARLGAKFLDGASLPRVRAMLSQPEVAAMLAGLFREKTDAPRDPAWAIDPEVLEHFRAWAKRGPSVGEKTEVPIPNGRPEARFNDAHKTLDITVPLGWMVSLVPAEGTSFQWPPVEPGEHPETSRVRATAKVSAPEG